MTTATETGLRARVDRKALYEALRDVKPFTARTTLPVLASVRLTAGDGTLRIAATDLDHSIEREIPANVDEPGVVLAPHAELMKLAHKLDCDELAIGTEGSDKVTVEVDGATFTLYTLPPDEFPALPGEDHRTFEVRTGFGLPVASFLDICERFPDFASTNESRPIMNGVHFEKDARNEVIHAIATDGYKALVEPFHLEGTEAISAIIPADFLKAARMVVKRSGDEGTATFELAENHARVSIAGTTFTVRIIEGPYPDIWQVVPRIADAKVRARMDTAELLKANETVDLIASDQTHRVRWTVGDSCLVELRVDTPDKGTACADVAAEIERPDEDADVPFVIGFNARYVAALGKALGHERLVWDFTTPARAALVRDAYAKSGRFAILMPLRLLD